MMEETQLAPRKIKLRRHIPGQNKPTEEVIKRNLEPLIVNTEKKKRAQELYYEKVDIGLSPLVRDLGKKPVKLRLGGRCRLTGTNTYTIPPKHRLRRLSSFIGISNNNFIMRKHKMFSAQQRLNNIRATHQVRAVPKKIRLRRVLPGQNFNLPKNLKVEVPNHQHNMHKFKQILNPRLQAQIKELQLNFQGGTWQELDELYVIKVTPVATSIRISDRFLKLSEQL